MASFETIEQLLLPRSPPAPVDSDSDPHSSSEDQSLHEKKDVEDAFGEDEGEQIQNSSELEDEDYSRLHDSPVPIRDIPLIMDAINTAPRHRLQDLLKDIVYRVSSARAITSETLLVFVTRGVKRKAYETCKNCDEEYHVSENDKTSCNYHTGKKILDSDGDFWEDHDWNADGDPSSLVDDWNYEDGFKWTCCDKSDYEIGCVVKAHQPEKVFDSKRQIMTRI